MSEDFVYWLVFLLAVTMAFFFGNRYMADTAVLSALSVEVRGSTQSASSHAFSSLSLESIGERNLITDRAHRGIELDKSVSALRFEDALKYNLGLSEDWKPVNSKYMDPTRAVVMTELHIVDSSDLPYNYNGKDITEPTVIVGLSIPVKLYSTKRDTLEVVRTIPLRTFITNWQR